MAVKAVPDGFHTVTPYLVVSGAAKLIEFVKAGLGATEVYRHLRPDGSVMHAQVRIGNSMVMLADANELHGPTPCSLYLYVEDVDALYARALAAGATSIMPPANMFYGDRNAGVKDASGMQWWIGAHVEDVSDEEMTRRQLAQAAQPKKN